MRWGVAVLVLGFLAVVAGVAVLVPRDAECGGQPMGPGDTCTSVSVGGGGTRTSTSQYRPREGGNPFVGGALIAAGIGLAGFAVVRGRGVARSRRGESAVRVRVTVPAGEAAGGTTRDVTFTARRSCGACGGRGHTVGASGTLLCGRCETTGLDGRHRRTVHVRIPAGVRNDALLRVAGGGHAGGAARPDGDLLLRVRVPAPRKGWAAARSWRRPASAGAPGRAPSAPPRRSPTRSADASSGSAAYSGRPVTVQRDGVRFTADATGITVETERHSPRGDRWQTHAAHAWRDIALLVFDSDRSDAVIALYAVPAATSGTGGTRSHLVDARAFTRPQWERIAESVERAGSGQIVLDLRGLAGGRPPRDT